MLGLIPVVCMWLAFGPVGIFDGGSGDTQLRNSISSEQAPMTGKPVKIPPKKG